MPWLPLPTGGASSFDDLTDVDMTTTPPTDGQVPVFDDSDDTWKPGTLSGSANTIVTKYQTLTNKTTFSASNTFEQWGTEEVVFAQADLPADVTVEARVIGVVQTVTEATGTDALIKLQTSLDGGSTWSDGPQTRVFRVNNVIGGLIWVSCSAHVLRTGSPTGDVQVRVVANCEDNVTHFDFLDGTIIATARTANASDG